MRAKPTTTALLLIEAIRVSLAFRCNIGQNTFPRPGRRRQSTVEFAVPHEIGIPKLTLFSTIDSSAQETEATIQAAPKLKRDLLALCAAYDRGFGATPAIRSKVQSIIDELKAYNPTEDAAIGVDGEAVGIIPPLEGTWQMVWTTALDVLSLASSPLITVSAIYQDIEPPIATNIIDIIPRFQAAFPPDVLPSLTRLKVKTRANRRTQRNRVGLVFETVQASPVDILGMRVPESLPPLSFNLPRIDSLMSSMGDSAPGFFDVLYLDDDMLIISQNDPGGIFVSVKVPNSDIA